MMPDTKSLWMLPVLFLVGVAVAADDALLPTPYQVEGVTRDSLDRWGEPGAPGPWIVIVDLGNAKEGTPVPSADAMRQMTLVGSSGISGGFVREIRRVCRFLCGEDDGETCHFVADVVPQRPLDEIGTPWAAFAGTHELAAFRALLDRAEPVSRPIPPDWLTGDFVAPAGETLGAPSSLYRLAEPQAADRELRIESRWANGHVEPFEDLDCRMRETDALTELRCSSSAMILEDGRPLLISMADYNEPAAVVVSSFEYGGRTYYVVRLGLKAQTVHGLLVRTELGWRFLGRARDYALIC